MKMPLSGTRVLKKAQIADRKKYIFHSGENTANEALILPQMVEAPGQGSQKSSDYGLCWGE